MGVTAIWISPPVDNENKNIGNSANRDSPIGAPYHGYHARDFMRIEEHFGDAANSWTPFDNLVKAARDVHIRIIVDFAPNHSNNYFNGEEGAFFDNGKPRGNFTMDKNRYFHHYPEISDWNDRYQLQYFTLPKLADFDQENPEIDIYLKSATRLFQQHGVDGFRIDAIKHANWGWLYSFVNDIYTNRPSFVFGEWVTETIFDPLYHDLYKFVNRSGFSALDFPLYRAIDDVFARDQGFDEIDSVLSREAVDFQQSGDLVTFLDNHDRQRFLSINKDHGLLHQALAFLLTCRGIPVIYYGTEQYLHNDRKRDAKSDPGGDPYNRPMMRSFDTHTPAYLLIAKLAGLRKSNPAIGNGVFRKRWITHDAYIYERSFAGSVVLVAINKSPNAVRSVAGLFTLLPPGTWRDYLNGALNGVALTVADGGGNNPAVNLSLPPQSVSVWQFQPAAVSTPALASIGPDVAQPTVEVTLAGSFAGTNVVKFGETPAPLVRSSASQIVVKVPAVPDGSYNVTVWDSKSRASDALPFTVLGGKLVPVSFTVRNAAPTGVGDYIFLTGSNVELGKWSTTWDGAVGPMLSADYPNWSLGVSLPAGETVEFQFIRIASDGKVTREKGPPHKYRVPWSGVGRSYSDWQWKSPAR